MEACFTRRKKAGLQLEVDGTLLRIKGAVKNTELAKALLDRKRDIIPILRALKSGPNGARTTARCRSAGCDGILYVKERARVCEKCGATIEEWIYT